MAVAEVAKLMTSSFWAGRGVLKASKESDPTIQTCRIAAAGGSAYGALRTANSISSDIDKSLFNGSGAAVEALKIDTVAKSATGQALKSIGSFANKHVNKFVLGASLADIAAAPKEKRAEVASTDLTGFAGMYLVESAMKKEPAKAIIAKVVDKIPYSGKFGVVKAIATTAIIVGGSLLGTATGRKLGEEAYKLFSSDKKTEDTKQEKA